VLEGSNGLIRDMDGRIVTWSAGAERLYGWRADEAEGRVSHRLLAAVLPRPLPEIQSDLLREGRWKGEVQHRRRDGTMLHVAADWLLLRDEAGQPAFVFEMNNDITSFARARESQRYLAAIVESAHAAMIGRTLDGTITSWNRAAQEMFGHPAHEVIGRSIALIVPPDRLAEESDVLRRIRAGEVVEQSEEVRRRRDGSEIIVSMTNSPIRDEAGRVIGASLTARDVTRRKRTEDALHYQLALVQAITDNAAEALFLCDGEGRVTFMNPAAERMFGWRRDEMLGRVLHDAIHYKYPDGRPFPASECPSDRLYKNCERVVAHEDTCFHRDGTPVIVSCSSTPIVIDGKQTGVVLALQDVSSWRRAEDDLRRGNDTLEQRVEERSLALEAEMEARRRAEAALHQSQKLEAVGQLTGGVAHDFNNLLTVISGNLHFVAEVAERDERLRRLVRGMQRAVDRGARLTAQLLAFSRRQTLRPEVVRVDSVIADFAGLVQRAVGESVRLECRGEKALWSCEIDPAQFESAVLNLAINARDAMPSGGLLSITSRNLTILPQDAQRDLGPGRYVSVTVIDTGAGMPPDVLARAIEPFFTTKEVGKGSGLGLSQVYGFVQQSGGALRIESRPSEGATVTMLFPAGGPDIPARPDPELRAEDRPARPATVVVAEDDADVLDLIEATLTEAGHHVLVAADGQQALALLEDRDDIDVLISDVVMPNGLGGAELGRAARRVRPGVHVLLTSGYPRDEVSRQGGTDGFAFLAKPFRPAELIHAVHEALRRVDA
jgi:PAS domain S-box-containing protein